MNITSLEINGQKLEIPSKVDFSKMKQEDITDKFTSRSDSYWIRYEYTAEEDCIILVEGHGGSSGYYTLLQVVDQDGNIISSRNNSNTKNSYSYDNTMEVYKGCKFIFQYTRAQGFDLTHFMKITFKG